MNLLIKIISAAVILISGVISAQSPDSLIAEALANNPQLKALDMKIRSREYRSESVNTLPPPSAGIEFSQVNIKEYNIWDKALSQNFFVSQMFPLGGKLSAMEDVENENVRIAERDYYIFRNKLASEIRSTYYRLWMIEHHIELREEIVELLSRLLESAEKSYIVNRTRYSDVVLLKSEIASKKTEVTVMEKQVESLIIGLNSLIGRELNDRELYVFHNWSIDTSSIDAVQSAEVLQNRNPELLKMENMINMNRLEITANEKELIPDLMLQGMVMRMPRGMILTESSPVHAISGTPDVEYMYGIMASVTLPFAPWSSGRYSNKTEELAAGIRSIEYERSDMFRKMKAELQASLNELESARAEITLLEGEVIPLYKEAVSSIISEYQNNLNTLSSVIETVRMYLMKEEELAEAMTGHQIQLAEIKKLTGEL